LKKRKRKQVDKFKTFSITNNPKPFQSPVVQNFGRSVMAKIRKGGHVHGILITNSSKP
jgi:hypothetical protein